ncbi:hypothetical protein LPB142_14945 [Rhodobacter xanthinilyticus]|uniref:DUF4139 domain-containing protein n=1 Tax=Rhodobacter xanthinilyticus TaxID=1850250 RepID=A0A1D9MFD0_9RHOB|nr:DUF4139 domain-containing protein [Rhodobacter xanthinilyticus]AOZ70469.1 hypothetical protein LPB142_14945 [Rhodobacter xanthinilyticus]
MKPVSLIAALCLCAAPAALFAAPLEKAAAPVAVTLYPWGAEVTRALEVSAAEPVEYLVTGLPAGSDMASLRVSGEGLEIGAVSLIHDRLPEGTGAVVPEAVAAARARVATAEEALAAGEDGVAAIRAEAEAARARAAFLSGAETGGLSPKALGDLAAAVSAGVLEANRAAIAAEAEARRASVALEPAREELAAAQKALAAIDHPGEAGDALLVTVKGAGALKIRSYTDAAGWAPAYDARIDRASGALTLDRYVSVHQESGEDWSGVALTLSTAAPSERAAPSELWPEALRYGPPEPVAALRAEKTFAADAEPMMEAAPAPVIVGDGVAQQGVALSYAFDGPVDLRDGVEGLRLKLGAVALNADLFAEAVPYYDATAYRVAEAENTSGEVLLAGPAMLWVDGEIVGATDLPQVVAGDRLRLGFGAIEGLRLTRVTEDSAEGGRGLISKTNERSERVRIEVKNLTAESWPVRLIDRVPYAEQEDLKISYAATPAPAEEGYEDKRGLLVWRFDVAPGATQTVSLETTINWPEGQILR